LWPLEIIGASGVHSLGLLLPMMYKDAVTKWFDPPSSQKEELEMRYFTDVSSMIPT